MSRLAALGMALITISACATIASPLACFGEDEWRQGVTERGLDPAAVVYPFRASPELAQWAWDVAGRFVGMGPITRLSRVQQALFDADDFMFDYSDTLTLTAADAFAQRRGNCLSFTSLFVAATRSIGLDTFLVAIRSQPEFAREQDLVVVNHHVVAGYSEGGHLHLYDFFERSRVPEFQYQVIDDVEASAMYHNNIGGAAIRGGDLETARANLELATRLAPTLTSALVNLGVVYHRLGDDDAALNAYRRALEISPGHSSALTNLAYMYLENGRQEEGRAALMAAAHGSSTPFTLISLADAEMARGELNRARRYLRKARRIGRRQPEVYRAMARLAKQEGRDDAARQLRRRAADLQMRLAEEEGVPSSS